MSEKAVDKALEKTVVVMDDSELVLDTLRVVLESQGFQVRTAMNLGELETQLTGINPDIFVLDVQMPEMFGEDVAQVLRDVRAYQVPIVLYSSVEESSLRERAREAGVEYVQKQTGPNVLVKRIRSILGEGVV